MPQLIPAILAKTKKDFLAKLKSIDGIAPMIQIDVMDGAFVKNKTWFDLITLNGLRTKSSFELHLMVKNPADFISRLEELPNIARVIWHIEAAENHLDTIRLVRHQGWQAGMAISPDTRLTKLEPFLDLIDEVLVMGSAPGFSGKELEMRMVDRVQELHANHPELAIGFDIGVNAKTIPMLVRAGVSRLCTASAIFGAENPKKAYRGLVEIADI